MAIIRPMTQVEERTLLEWAAVEGWNPGLHDADCFWKLDPDGFLALDLEGQMVGGGAIIRHHDQFGFMGLFIVQPAYRSQKLGTQLWYARRDQLLERLKPASSIGLDAIDAMVPFYARGGFEPLTRHRRFQLIESAGVAACSVVAGEACVDLREVDFAEVVAWDAGCFPGDRHLFVNAWIRQPDAVSLGVVAHGKLAGYGVMRACQIGYKIGPLFARDPSVADRIFRTFCRHAAGQQVFIDVPDNNPAAGRLCKDHGMREVFGCVRMYLGPVPRLDNARIFAITTFEVG